MQKDKKLILGVYAEDAGDTGYPNTVIRYRLYNLDGQNVGELYYNVDDVNTYLTEHNAVIVLWVGLNVQDQETIDAPKQYFHVHNVIKNGQFNFVETGDSGHYDKFLRNTSIGETKFDHFDQANKYFLDNKIGVAEIIEDTVDETY